MRAMEFLTERKVPSIKDQILAAVKKDGGNIDDYFVRFTMTDKLGFSNKQWFPKTLDVDDPNFSVDYIGHKGGKRSLWFYPLKTYLEDTHLYAKEQPYVWLVKKKPNAWLQTVDRGDNKLENPPPGKERVGIIRMSEPPAAIFFQPAYTLIGKYYDYAGRHKRHGLVKGPPPPTKSQPKTFFQKIKDKIFTEAKDTGKGDCFEVAGRAMIHPKIPGLKLVHAYVSGQGKLEGQRFPHAWNEVGDVVLDNSNGRNIVLRKEQYYDIGKVVEKPGEYAVYNDIDAKKKMVRNKHYGPWDLK